MIGEITIFAGKEKYIPDGWLLCKGQYLDPEEYPVLWECIGNVYGLKAGKFRLPELPGGPINDMTGRLETTTRDMNADQRVVLDAKRDKNLKYIIHAFEPVPPQPEQPQG